MKKQLFIITLLMLTSIISFAQLTSKTKSGKKFVIALTGGPSFPVGKYEKKDINQPQSGYARFGYNLNLNFNYQADKNFGLTSTIIYSRHKLNIDEIKKDLNNPNLSVDHYQYYGILAGPMATINLSDKVMLDIKLMAGVAEANSPVFSLSNTQITNEKWNEAFTWQYGTALRYNFNESTCLFTNIYYNHMKPNWNFGPFTNGGTEKFVKVEQNMSVLDMNLGLGINF
jgi:hypothetical protein